MGQVRPGKSESDSDEARENLRLIRDLMERATVYRAVAAFPALVGGVLAIIASLLQFIFHESVGMPAFVFSWLGILIAVGILNTWLFYRDCQQKGAEFPSPQMRHGLLAMGPPMIVMGSLGLIQVWAHGDFVFGVLLWVFGYGLGLLATSNFAPDSIKLLGRQFIGFGIGFVILHEFGVDRLGENTVRTGAFFMGLSFGLLHLSYALQAWRDAKRAA